MNRFWIALISIGMLLALGVGSAPGEVFQDDFNRPDGPLGPPWEILESLLYIESERVVANPYEYGLMLYGEQIDICHCPEASLWATIGFPPDPGPGRFQFFLIGSDEPLYWGFIAKIGLEEVSIYSFPPEIELVSAPSPLAFDTPYEMEFAYYAEAVEISLIIRDEQGTPVVTLSDVQPSEPFSACAIGIENLEQLTASGWIDDVIFEYCCDPTDVAATGAAAFLRAWPQPFRGSLQLAAGLRGTDAAVEIYDVSGRRLRVLALPGGRGVWDGRDDDGLMLPAGIYMIRSAGGAELLPLKVLKLR